MILNLHSSTLSEYVSFLSELGNQVTQVHNINHVFNRIQYSLFCIKVALNDGYDPPLFTRDENVVIAPAFPERRSN